MLALCAAAALAVLPCSVLQRGYSVATPASHCRFFRRSPLVACSATDAQSALFDSLLSAKCAGSAAVALSPPSAAGRSLVATRDVAAGDAILTIPKSTLLTAHRSGVISGLQGQTDLTWEVAGDLREEVGAANFARGATWDVRLALAVFEACAGSGGDFWDAYRRLLPPPPRLAHPLTLPEELLVEVQDEALVERTRALRARLVDLYPDLDTHSCHPATTSYEAMGAPMGQVRLRDDALQPLDGSTLTCPDGQSRWYSHEASDVAPCPASHRSQCRSSTRTLSSSRDALPWPTAIPSPSSRGPPTHRRA